MFFIAALTVPAPAHNEEVIVSYLASLSDAIESCGSILI